MFRKFNPNPRGKTVGDCPVRALCAAFGEDWDTIYTDLCREGRRMGDMPSANAVWGVYLQRRGFARNVLPDQCPDCYTVEDFCADHPWGTFILALSGHVVCVRDGELLDSWDSSKEVPLYFWERVR